MAQNHYMEGHVGVDGHVGAGRHAAWADTQVEADTQVGADTQVRPYRNPSQSVKIRQIRVL